MVGKRPHHMAVFMCRTPQNFNALIGGEGHHLHFGAVLIHLPSPHHFLVLIQTACGVGEPLLGGDGGIDKGFKHFCNGTAYQHLR